MGLELHSALARVAGRLRWVSTLRVALLVLCAVCAAGVLSRALRLSQTVNAPLWALCLLTGILGLCLIAYALVRELLQSRVTLERAAVLADRRGEGKDELTSALWFSDRPAESQWVTHHIARASLAAKGLDPARLVPLGVPRATWALAALAVMFFGLPALAPALRSGLQPGHAAIANDAEAAQARRIRELIKQTSNAEVAGKLEQALSALEKRSSSQDDKRKALAEAKEAVEQHNMEMNSMREGLMQLAERLRNSQETGSRGEEKPGEQADRAKELLDRMLEQRGRQAHSDDLDPEALAREKEMEKLLEQASKLTGTGEGQHIESAPPKAAVDRLDKIASQLESQSSANSAMRQLTQMQQLQVAQTTVQSAGRYSSSQAQQNTPQGTPSPDTGQTAMSGGIMFRTAAVARGDKPSESQEGSKTGAAAGESQADPVLGKKETPLAVKLKREAIRKEGEEGETGSEGWYYSESRGQASRIALQGVRVNTRYVQGEAMEPEQISLKHRQVVKDYFLNLHEVKPQ